MVIFIMLLLTGCAEESTATIVQVATLTPISASTRPATPQPASPTFCRPSDLVAISLWELDGSGASSGVIVFTNQSPNNCILQGKPDQIQFINAKGLVLFTTTPLQENSVANLILRPGEKANVALVWTNWCRPDQPIDGFSIKISLTGGTGQITAPSVATNNVPAFRGPACNSTQLPTYLEIGQFQAGSGNRLVQIATASVPLYTPDLPATLTAGVPSTFTAIALTYRAVPTPLPTPTIPSGTQACQAADLQGKVYWQGAGGSMVGGIDFTNHSAKSCSLTGVPPVQLLDKDGQLLPLIVDGPICFSCPFIPTEYVRGYLDGLKVGVIAIKPGEIAQVMLFWSNWCSPKPALPITVRVTLPVNSQQINIPALELDSIKPLASFPRCDVPESSSGLTVGPFELLKQ